MPGNESLDTPEQAEVRQLARQIVSRQSPDEKIRSHDEAHTFDHELYRGLGEAGLVGLGVDAASSAHPDARYQVAVVEELAAGPTSMAVCLIVQYMGVQLLTTLGTREQKEDVLAPLAGGAQRIAFALTEPDAGTDVAAAMRTRAERSDGRWVLSGTKTWISGPKVADHVIVVARTGPAEPSRVDGISLFVVPTTAPGLRIRELDTVGINSLDTCELVLDEVQVPETALLGAVGAGFRSLLATLNQERLNAAAAALGIAEGAFVLAVRYAGERHAFDRPVGAFQALQHRLVQSALRIESARGLLNRAADAAASGERADVLSAMAKLAASEAATEVTDQGMRILGGAGYSREFAMQRYFRDARLYTFAPLTDEMLKNYLGEQMLGLPRSF
ncbi:acyl-CoA/acyl-ACP dehydrogenase [Saccharopolyspora erythraea]|nr:acyl-CoA/acyl-ACP dehydrogenase [Saccharopolyspora erythraea]